LRKKVGNLLITSDSDWERFKAMMFLGKKIELPFFSRIKMMVHTKNVIYEFFKKCPLIDGTQETLDFLKENNVKLGICTNASRSEMNVIFNGREEILEYFDGNIITKDDVKHKKPDPEGVFKLINKWGISPQNIMIFGDYETDIQAGKEAGIITVGVLSGSGNLELFKKLKSSAIFI
ncbi:MAG: HAD family hydrolase, partial [Promethearchaeota archaeon]